MPSDRRFSEREIREVFERAAAQQQAAAQEPDGLTLAEMQEVAASAGIDPAFVARAAEAVALGEPEQGRTSAGLVPTGVYRTELLAGPPTAALWASLLSDLRHTFNAEGRVRADGAVREWRNGQLRATLEPAGTGSRLSLRTRRDGRASGVATLGGVALVGLVALLVSLAVYGDPSAAMGWAGMLAGGLAGMAGVWAEQRSWAATREAQMADVAARARERSAPPDPLAAAAPELDLDALGEAPGDASQENASQEDALPAASARRQRSGG